MNSNADWFIFWGNIAFGCLNAYLAYQNFGTDSAWLVPFSAFASGMSFTSAHWFYMGRKATEEWVALFGRIQLYGQTLEWQENEPRKEKSPQAGEETRSD